MRAAAKAAKGKGQMPPQLWKRRMCAPPSMSEFDRLDYRELVTGLTLENVYEAVNAFKSGNAAKSPELMKFYVYLVKEGIAGIGT